MPLILLPHPQHILPQANTFAAMSGCILSNSLGTATRQRSPNSGLHKGQHLANATGPGGGAGGNGKGLSTGLRGLEPKDTRNRTKRYKKCGKFGTKRKQYKGSVVSIAASRRMKGTWRSSHISPLYLNHIPTISPDFLLLNPKRHSVQPRFPDWPSDGQHKHEDQ